MQNSPQDAQSGVGADVAPTSEQFTKRLRRRALVVDDDQKVRELVSDVLSSTGMVVVSLPRSVEAADHLRDEKFAVVLFDFHMPSPDGLELSRQVRGAGLNQMTPIILFSDDQSTTALSQGFAAGATFFLYKPIDRERLLNLVRATQSTFEHEMRRFRRVALCSRVRLGFEKSDVEGETIDVSLNGLLVKAQIDVPARSPVNVCLYLTPETKPFLGSGLVTRILAGNRIAIQLNPLPVTESGKLQDLLLPLILKQAESRHSGCV
jgi:two-component system, chemotaxis family, chemotaxis protein CheY